jgi:hypothetical protein
MPDPILVSMRTDLDQELTGARGRLRPSAPSGELTVAGTTRPNALRVVSRRAADGNVAMTHRQGEERQGRKRKNSCPGLRPNRKSGFFNACAAIPQHGLCLGE